MTRSGTSPGSFVPVNFSAISERLRFFADAVKVAFSANSRSSVKFISLYFNVPLSFPLGFAFDDSLLMSMPKVVFKVVPAAATGTAILDWPANLNSPDAGVIERSILLMTTSASFIGSSIFEMFKIFVISPVKEIAFVGCECTLNVQGTSGPLLSADRNTGTPVIIISPKAIPPRFLFAVSRLRSSVRSMMSILPGR